ncbi:hypothetical protein BURMUCF2_2522, partial [Burkholderia multivorans CF2]
MGLLEVVGQHAETAGVRFPESRAWFRPGRGEPRIPPDQVAHRAARGLDRLAGACAAAAKGVCSDAGRARRTTRCRAALASDPGRDRVGIQRTKQAACDRATGRRDALLRRIGLSGHGVRRHGAFRAAAIRHRRRAL